MPDLTTDSQASSPRGGISGVALELISSSARGAVRAPLSLLKLPLYGLAQICSATDVVRRNYLGLAERGLSLIGLRNDTGEEGLGDPAGYLTEPESRDGEYAEFSPEFATVIDGGVAGAADPAMLADADADLIAELGTDFSADLDPIRAEPELAAAELNTAEVVDAEWAAEELEAAVADLQAAVGIAAEVDVHPVDVEPVDVEPADSEAVDIVTRAAVAAEEAAEDDSRPTVEREELPIEDFDHVTAGSLRGRLRRLELPELRTLRSYEQEHGHRLPILTLLENRIAKLEAVATA